MAWNLLKASGDCCLNMTDVLSWNEVAICKLLWCLVHKKVKMRIKRVRRPPILCEQKLHWASLVIKKSVGATDYLGMTGN